METKETSLTKSTLAVTTFDNFKTMEDMLSFGEQIAKSKLSPLKTGQDVVAAMLMGKELGFGVMASINNIYPIEGRASSGIHIILGILLKNNISYTILRDFEPVFDIALMTKEGDKETPIVIRQDFRNSPLNDGEKIGKNIKDYKTIIEFRRHMKKPDGTWREMIIVSSFSWNDAANAGLTDKSNWKNHGKTMVRTRALAIGARLIADDLLLGLMETSEMADSTGRNYIVEDNGNAVIIESPTPNNKNTTSNSDRGVTEAEVVN